MGFITSPAVGLGVLFSAETLILIGNGMGLGAWFPIYLLIGAGLHLLGAFTFFAHPSGPRNEINLLQSSLGSTAAVVFLLASRVSVALTASTGLVVTAGFIFNEVFVYWFPNFLFAFLILGLVLAVNIAGIRIWQGFQFLTALVTLAGLAVLIITGLVLSPPEIAVRPLAIETASWTRMALSAVLVPIGYELAIFADGSSREKRQSPAAAVLLGCVVLLLWGIVSMRWVDRASLAQTTIPYTLAARAVLGEEGRIIIGIVIVSGVAGAVNALFGGVSRMIAVMSAAGLMPALPGERRLHGRTPVLLMGGGTAVMLLLGVAGSPYLAAYLRGGLILWLIHYAVLHLAAFLTGRRGASHRVGGMAHISGGVVMILVASALLIFDEERGVIALFMIVVICAALILQVLWSGLAHYRVRGR